MGFAKYFVQIRGGEVVEAVVREVEIEFWYVVSLGWGRRNTVCHESECAFNFSSYCVQYLFGRYRFVQSCIVVVASG